MMFNDYHWHSIWEYDRNDELRYEAGTLEIPEGEPVSFVREGLDLRVGQQVWHEPSGAKATILAITYWDRCGGYYNVLYSTDRFDGMTDVAENFTPIKRNWLGQEIPV